MSFKLSPQRIFNLASYMDGFGTDKGKSQVKVKGKAHPGKDHEGPEGE